jgi:8-oxo-dGTP diphosphatase
MRSSLYNLVSSISPHDALEQEHIADVLTWINSGAQLFRMQKPAVPPKHLVSYVVLLDKAKNKILLVKHNKANLWLPAGGHVELHEDPGSAAARELKEELGVIAEFLFKHPIFITVTKTRNIDSGHTDVSLWYVVNGSSAEKLTYDVEEMSGYKWFSLEEPLPFSDCDPHMSRFIQKLQAPL